MRVALHQPHYLPWLGYIDKIDRVDLFVIVDHVQFERNGWQNRNEVKTADGRAKLTVPVSRGAGNHAIVDKRISNADPWRSRHRSTIRRNYRKAPYWERYGSTVLAIYDQTWEHLVDVALASMRMIVDELGVRTEWVRTSELGPIDARKSEMVAEVCHRVGAGTYVTGSGSQDYLDVEVLGRRGIDVEWQDFVHPEYSQLHPRWEFLPRLAAIDLLLNEGSNGLSILRSTRSTTPDRSVVSVEPEHAVDSIGSATSATAARR